MEKEILNGNNLIKTESYLDLLSYIISYPASKQPTPFLLITLSI